MEAAVDVDEEDIASNLGRGRTYESIILGDGRDVMVEDEEPVTVTTTGSG
jgi:hypothetical protein